MRPRSEALRSRVVGAGMVSAPGAETAVSNDPGIGLGNQFLVIPTNCFGLFRRIAPFLPRTGQLLGEDRLGQRMVAWYATGPWTLGFS